jgi:hypothetical protein
VSKELSLCAGALSVCFHRDGDRQSHVIGVTLDGILVPILESIEGSPSEPWPASAPLQQIVEETIGSQASPVLLGVGLSGNGHWSCAVESPNDASLKFDLACRNSKGATFLGSSYQVLARQSSFSRPCFNSESEQGVAFSEIEVDSVSRLRIQVSVGKMSLSECGSILILVPESDSAKTLTHRWCYEFSFVRHENP